MTTALVPVQPQNGGALSLGVMTPHDAWLFAESLARTSLLPDAYRNNASSVLWALEYGRALGLDVVTTICTIHVIKGKPTQSADLMLGRARAAGHRVRIQSERERCVVTLTRADDPEFDTVVEWTLADAVTACLCTLTADGKPYSRDDKGRPQSWERYPRAMLRSRAVAEAVRTACPEVLHGAIYTPEELGVYVDQEGNPVEAPAEQPQVIRVEQVQPAAPAPHERDWLGDARKAPDVDAARELYREAQALGAPQQLLDDIAAVAADKVKPTEQPPAAAEDGIPDAEIVPDEPLPGAPALPVTDPQLRKVGALCRELGLTDRDETLAYVAGVIGRDIKSRKELTKVEAGRLIDHMEKAAAA